MAKQKHKITAKKALKNFAFGVAALVVLIAAMYFLPYMPKVKNTIADADDNISGWAWAPAIGWISFNNANIADSAVAYGVNLDSSSGDFTSGSYAWNSSVGWLDFNPAGAAPAVSTGDDYNYPVEMVDGELRGWAKFTSMSAGGGWVRFHPDPNDAMYGQWGVELADEEECSGEGEIGLEGYAWSNDFGWINFSGEALDGSKFGVYLSASPSAPSNVDAERSISSPCSAISVSWSYAGTGATGFEIQRKTTLGGWVSIGSVGAGIFGYVDSGLTPGVKYFYRVRALGECDNSAWAASGEITTSTVCPFSPGPGGNLVLAVGQCPSNIIVSWDAPSAASSANIVYSIFRKEVKDENGNIVAGAAWIASSSGTCATNPAPPSCADAVSGGASSKKTYIYKVIATDTNSGDFAEAESNEAIPCLSSPTWIER